MTEIMSNCDESGLDFNSALLLWRIVDGVLLPAGDSERVTKVSTWLLETVRSNATKMNEQQKLEVVVASWHLQMEMARVRKDTEGQAIAIINMMQVTRQSSHTTWERVAWLSLCVRLLQDVGDAYSEIVEDITELLDDEYARDTVDGDPAGADSRIVDEDLDVEAHSPYFWADSGALDKAGTSETFMQWPQADGAGECDVSFGWLAADDGSKILPSCLRVADWFSEQVVERVY